jgi:uncharacterized protein RhaS with RHS repeats
VHHINRARYYDPIKGRFFSEDPLGFRGGSIDFYVYANNSAPNFLGKQGTDGTFSDARDQANERGSRSQISERISRMGAIIENPVGGLQWV